jgi:hypothetical protein
MAIVFMAFFAIIVAEYVSARVGRLSFLPLEVLGVGSVVYWHFTEVAGHGDLRPYIITQFLPIILIPLILVFFPARLWPARYLWAVLGTYVLAKLLELFDAQVFALLGHSDQRALVEARGSGAGHLVFLLALRRRYAAVR